MEDDLPDGNFSQHVYGVNTTEELNGTEPYNEMETLHSLYKYYIPLMFILCLISIIVNVRVLLSVHWIRRPLSPTLYISLSLAAADLCSSALLCLALILNSYLPQVFEYHTPHNISTGLEMYRLSGILITVIHLLALSINHWLGILKPLHYTTIVTPRKIKTVTIFLWILPIVFFNMYFRISSETYPWEDYTENTTCFLQEMKFRASFSLLLAFPIAMMVLFYAHILFMVRRQQKVWAQLSRSGSKRCKSLTKSNTQQRRTMEGNVKAVYTTLLILGSCMVGWIPAMTMFLLVCQNCLYNNENVPLSLTVRFFIGWVTNTLIILKTLANPIIYTTRMMEIKEGMHRMHLAMMRVFCNANRGQMNHGVTALCNLNGTLTTRKSIRSTNYPNTLV